MRKKILFIMHLPPPVHGLSTASENIKRDSSINQEFSCRYVNLSVSRDTDEVSKYSFFNVIIKLWRFSISLLQTLWLLITFHPKVAYITITCHGIPFLKDTPFVLLCKIFKCRIILHQHNKGMSAYANKPLYRFLFPLVYKNTTVILLSQHLYHDVSPIVKQEQIIICPNGI